MGKGQLAAVGEDVSAGGLWCAGRGGCARLEFSIGGGGLENVLMCSKPGSKETGV